MTYRYRDTSSESSRKISWVLKQASNESPSGYSRQIRVATPRNTGKIPGMGGVAKNPFNSMQKIKVPKIPQVPKIKVADSKWEGHNNFFPGAFDGKHVIQLRQKDIDSMTDEEYRTYRKQMNKLHRSNALSGAAVGILGSPMGPGMVLGGMGIAATSPLLYKTRRRKKDREKRASYSHEYYMANRQRIKQRNKQWRMANAHKIRISRRRYQRELAAGARRKAKRIRSGSSYMSYGGY